MAAACPICSGAAKQSPAQELIDLPRAVLVTAEAKQYRVVQVIKGEPPEAVLSEVLRRDAADAGQTLLLVRDDAWPMWVSLGGIDARHAALLRELAVPRPAPAETPAWRRRVDLSLPHLQSREPLLAEIAYAECASAPYAVLRAARPQLEAKLLRRWVDDPQLAARWPLYLLLLGIAGQAGDAAAIEAHIDAAWRTHGVAKLASLLAADTFSAASIPLPLAHGSRKLSPCNSFWHASTAAGEMWRSFGRSAHVLREQRPAMASPWSTRFAAP